MSAMSIERRAAGFTLIELIIAIVVLGVGLAGVLSAFNAVVRNSADPLVGKQMLAVAEELMEEIRLQPFADPNGAAAPANVVTACGAAAARTAFDDVFDYNGYQTTGVCDIDGNAVGGLENYNVTVAVVKLAALGGNVPADNTAQITVTVASPGQSTSLVGWRTSYR